MDKDIVQQLWGEFVGYYKAGFDFGMNRDEADQLDEHRENFMYVDAVEDEIDRNLSTWSSDFITSKELARLLGVDDLVGNRQLAKKIKYVMDNRRDWKPAQKRIDNVPTRGYKKK